MTGLHKTMHEIAADARVAGTSIPMAALTSRGLQALTCYRLARLLLHWRIPLVPFALTRLAQILYAIDIDPECEIAGGVILRHGVGIVVGKGTYIGPGCLIFHGVTLGVSDPSDSGYPWVGSDVLLGANATVLGRCRIGDGARVGAGAVVTKDVPAHRTVVGNPARLLDVLPASAKRP